MRRLTVIECSLLTIVAAIVIGYFVLWMRQVDQRLVGRWSVPPAFVFWNTNSYPMICEFLPNGEMVAEIPHHDHEAARAYWSLTEGPSGIELNLNCQDSHSRGAAGTMSRLVERSQIFDAWSIRFTVVSIGPDTITLRPIGAPPNLHVPEVLQLHRTSHRW